MSAGRSDTLLSVENLEITLGRHGAWSPVRNVTFDVKPGETVGIVGESGSGKSLSCRSVLRMLPPGMRVTGGRLLFDGRDILRFGRGELQALRRTGVGMVFQDPFSSLNPTYRVGSQLAEVLRISAGLDHRAARSRAIELLDRVEIADPARRFSSYPGELSGGMRQRVMIAMAIAAAPRLLIADEATTALDVTTQAQILKLLRGLRDESGMAILLVSHDIGVVAETCERIVVMYGGHVLEAGPTASVLRTPGHPYTAALLRSIPTIASAGHPRRLAAIPGQPPEPGGNLAGCPFAPRCEYRQDACEHLDMQLSPAGRDHDTACPFAGPGVPPVPGPLPTKATS